MISKVENVTTHSAVLASAGAGIVLAAASVATELPWALWGAWAVLSTVAVGQAIRR